jgi:hypothetical protein
MANFLVLKFSSVLADTNLPRASRILSTSLGDKNANGSPVPSGLSCFGVLIRTGVGVVLSRTKLDLLV